MYKMLTIFINVENNTHDLPSNDHCCNILLNKYQTNQEFRTMYYVIIIIRI